MVFDSIPDLCLLLYFAIMPEPWKFSQFVQFGISLYHIASMHDKPNGISHFYQHDQSFSTKRAIV